MSNIRMSLHLGDYRKDTGNLRAAGHGAYLLLLMHYMTTGEPPPDNDDELSAIVCMSRKEWKTHRSRIEKFFYVFDGKWIHKRCEEELATYGKRSRNGKNNANRRWGNSEETTCQSHESGIGLASESQCHDDASLAPAISKKEEELSLRESTRAPPGTRMPDTFDLTQKRFEFAETQMPATRIAPEFEKFRDYWRQSSGRTAVKRDWDAAWRYWCRRAADFTTNHREPPHGQPWQARNSRDLGFDGIAEILRQQREDGQDYGH